MCELGAHDKTFDLFVFPGGRTWRRRGRLTYYGNHKQGDYFVHHLLGVEPPNRNALAPTSSDSSPDQKEPPHGSLFAGAWSEIEAGWGK